MTASAGLAAKGMLCDPGDHFTGQFEVERKYRVASLAGIRTRLGALDARPFAIGNVETDLFLDQADGRLASSGRQLVLRSMQPSGRVLWIAKGPGADECTAMDLADFSQARAMHRALGFVEIGELRKDRDIYFRGDFHVTLDRVPGLGSFVEIAVMTDIKAELSGWAESIEQEGRRLGLGSDQLETRSYRTMLEI